jgi:CheY-like chemotaxis protein
LRKKRAIVFDDEPVILELLSTVLERRGFEVVAFSESAICPTYYKDLDNCENMNPCADVLITDNKSPVLAESSFS